MIKSELLKELENFKYFKIPSSVLPKDYVLLKVDELDYEPTIIRKKSSEIRSLYLDKKK